MDPYFFFTFSCSFIVILKKRDSVIHRPTAFIYITLNLDSKICILFHNLLVISEICFCFSAVVFMSANAKTFLKSILE